jgi:DNA-directed RNA polymerase subunit RPC12/RpoP
MKAIVCPQCGGLIDDVSERRTIAKCGYCGARVLIEQVVKPKPEPPARDTLHVPLENYKPFDEYDPAGSSESGQEFYVEEPATTTLRVLGAVGAIGVVVLVLVFMGFVVSRNAKPKQSFTSTPAPYRTATPFQPLRVEPVTNEDAVSLPKPVIPKNLKIARRTDIEVYVSVDEQGNVYDASTTTGIEALKKVAIETAMKAKFRPSPTNQRTSGLLIYTIGPQ